MVVVAVLIFAIMQILERKLPFEFKSIKWIVTAIPIVVLGIVILFRGIKVIDQTEVGVVKIFGKVDHTISSGLNFVNPISNSVELMDLRVHVRESQFASYTKDAQPLTASIEYQYELLPENAMKVASQYGSYEILETKLANVVEERAKIVFSKYGAMSLLENRSTLSSEVWEEIKVLEKTFPVHFTSIVIKDIDFSDAFESAVEAKMEAEQKALRAENEKKEAITRAEQEKEVSEIEAQAAVAKAKGEADALMVTKEALEKMPESYISRLWIDKWNGALPKFIGDDSNVMINPDLDN